MSGTLTLSAGEVFTGGTTLADGDTGTIALSQVGTVTFNTATSPPVISNVLITQDAAASSVSEDGLFIDSVTIDSVTPDSTVTLTTADLPPGVTVPSGFTLPQNVVGTTLGVTVLTNDGTVTGTVALYGTNATEALVAVESLDVFGIPVNAGAAILSLGVQSTGTVSDSFTPDYSPAAPCFAAGTRIRTPGGEVAVEALREGDLVATAEGAAAPVVWLGRRRVSCQGHPQPWDVQPVRVSAGAFGPGTPTVDLWLSPDHAVFIDGALIPVRYLLNGATIVQLPVASVEYWHVELPVHGIVLAEGLPCESYLDTGNRAAFGNGGAAMQLHPGFARQVWSEQGCAPLVVGGPRLAAVKRHLIGRAAALGHPVTTDPGLRIAANGCELPAIRAGNVWRIRLPDGTPTVRLTSRIWRPAEMHPASEDTRALGVAISRLWLDGREASLGSAGLAGGWHASEPGCRWTDGDATLMVEGVRELAFEVAMAGLYWPGGEAAKRAA